MGIYEILAGPVKKREARVGSGPALLRQSLSAAAVGQPARAPGGDGARCNDFVTKVMTLGELVLEALSSGVITEPEIDWLISEQSRFSRPEQAAVQRLGRLLDQGGIQLGCRLSSKLLRHRQVRDEWIEPLGRRRGVAQAA